MNVRAIPTLVLSLAAGVLACTAQPGPATNLTARGAPPFFNASGAPPPDAAARLASLARRSSGLSLARAAALEDSLSSRGPQALATDAGLFAPVAVEAQPLAANIQRVIEALESLGTPLPADLRAELTRAGRARDAKTLQERIDARVLLAVHINPEARVKVARGPATRRAAAGRLHARAREDRQRKPRHAAPAHRQPAVGAGLRGHVEARRRLGCSSSTCAKTRTSSGAPIGSSTWRCSRRRR